MNVAKKFIFSILNYFKLNRRWREKDGIIYFSVISDGTTGEEWIKRLESEDHHINDYAKGLLRSNDFEPTSGVKTKIAVLKGIIFKDADRNTRKIREEASNCKFFTPNAEVACLSRVMFNNEKIKAMGLLSLVVMHEPIKVELFGGDDLHLLSMCQCDSHNWLDTMHDCPSAQRFKKCGFAFAISQTKPNN